MGQISRGAIPVVEWDRVNRATSPQTRGPVPAMDYPVENANVIRNKSILLLNRAGSHPNNPILAGLGMRDCFQVGLRDRLTGVFIFQDRRAPGPNLKSLTGIAAPGIVSLDTLVGSGQSLAGTPAAGAIRNYIRWNTAFGSEEKEFWAKSKDADIVALAGMPALDPVTLAAVERTAQIVDGSRTWLDIPIDFFVSWNDEFLELHRQIQGTPENGFLKSYGGAAFVTFFDTTPGTQGVGVKVNAVTDGPINDQHVIQVQNTVGLKSITVRFRSKAGSAYFVDVPILIRVLAAPSGSCLPPVDEPCGQMLVKRLTPLPHHVQSAASVPGVQDVVGVEAVPVDRDLFYMSLHAAIVGGEATLLVRRWKTLVSEEDLGGCKTQKIGGDLEYKPLRFSTANPSPGVPYQPAQMLTMCVDVNAERNLGVEWYTVQVKDGHTLSPAQFFPGPKSRNIAFYPAGETGGTDPCVTY